jgi:hypothetical protein
VGAAAEPINRGTAQKKAMGFASALPILRLAGKGFQMKHIFAVTMAFAVMTDAPAYSQTSDQIAPQPGQAIFEEAQRSGVIFTPVTVQGASIPNEPSYLQEASDYTGANRTYLSPESFKTTDFKNGMRQFDYFMTDGTAYSFIVGAPTRNIQGPPAFPILGGEEYFNGDVRNDMYFVSASGFCDDGDPPYSSCTAQVSISTDKALISIGFKRN